MKTERIYLHRQIASSQSSHHFLGKHFGIAARNEHIVFFVGEIAGELLPSFYILHLVKEQHRPSAIHFLMALKNQVEVVGGKTLQSGVFKIQIQHICPRVTISKHLVHLLEKKERFARTPHSHEHLQRETVQVILTGKHGVLLHIFLIIKQNLS